MPDTGRELVRAKFWDEIHDNTPSGWVVGQPGYDDAHRQWSQYAYDPSEKLVVGKRSREWTAVGQTELDCLKTMACCLGELKEGQWPK